MCASGGIKGHKTNHSLRATAATEMFRCGGYSHLRTYRQHLSAQNHTSNFPSTPQTRMPQISLQNLNGCTINFNCIPLPSTTQLTNSTEEYTETELDELLSLVNMYHITHQYSVMLMLLLFHQFILSFLFTTVQ